MDLGTGGSGSGSQLTNGGSSRVAQQGGGRDASSSGTTTSRGGDAAQVQAVTSVHVVPGVSCMSPAKYDLKMTWLECRHAGKQCRSSCTACRTGSRSVGARFPEGCTISLQGAAAGDAADIAQLDGAGGASGTGDLGTRRGSGFRDVDSGAVLDAEQTADESARQSADSAAGSSDMSGQSTAAAGAGQESGGVGRVEAALGRKGGAGSAGKGGMDNTRVTALQHEGDGAAVGGGGDAVNNGVGQEWAGDSLEARLANV